MSRENVNFESIRNRMKEVRKHLELSQEMFGKPMSIRRQDIHAYETGKKQPGLTVIMRLSAEYNISLDWLIRGCGDMFLDD